MTPDRHSAVFKVQSTNTNAPLLFLRVIFNRPTSTVALGHCEIQIHYLPIKTDSADKSQRNALIHELEGVARQNRAARSELS